MKRLTLIRRWYDDERTIGELYHGSDFIAYTMEPGKLDESPRVPTGFYYLECHGWEPDTTLRFRRTWALVGANVVHQQGDEGYAEGVRTAAVFHQGVRDEHTRACILLGLKLGRSRGEPGLLETAEAMLRLRDTLGEVDASLVIRGS